VSSGGEFRSDNTAPAHPAVLEALNRANSSPAGAYGDDEWTRRAESWFRDQFGSECQSFLVWNGTGANVCALRAAVRPWQSVITTEHAHIQVDECGAPELLAGAKLIDLPSSDAKLSVDHLREAGKRGVGFEHHVQPRVVSLTQTTEYGTAYSLDELGELATVARELGLLVHVDGARICNAAASLNCSLREVTIDLGVDLLSFGLTKNGAMAAEAVLVFNRELGDEFKYIRKQSTQLASKMRFLAAQVVALAEDDLWLENARHANLMAAQLANGLRDLPGIDISQMVQANAVFATMPADLTERLQRDFQFYLWNEGTGEVRLMTSWATTPEEVQRLVVACSGGAPNGP
jgi:threonine aldolase